MASTVKKSTIDTKRGENLDTFSADKHLEKFYSSQSRGLDGTTAVPNYFSSLSLQGNSSRCKYGY